METSVPSKFLSDIEYSVIMSDVIQSFGCIIKRHRPVQHKKPMFYINNDFKIA